MEASALGPSRKGRGSIKLPMGEETVIADIKGPGIIRHMWMTIRENTEKRQLCYERCCLKNLLG